MSCREGTGKAEYIPRETLPAGFAESLEPRLYHAMNPTADEYRGLFSKVRGYTGFELSSRGENEDIYRLLSIRERGYMNIHDRPFTYYRELLPLAERFEEVTQVKAAELFDPQAFRELSSQIRKKADDILRRDFDVRGHRSLEKYLGNPDTALLVGNVSSSGYSPKATPCTCRRMTAPPHGTCSTAWRILHGTNCWYPVNRSLSGPTG